MACAVPACSGCGACAAQGLLGSGAGGLPLLSLAHVYALLLLNYFSFSPLAVKLNVISRRMALENEPRKRCAKDSNGNDTP